MERLGFRLPVVETSGDGNVFGRRMGVIKANGDQFRASGFEVVMVFVVFHSCLFIEFKFIDAAAFGRNFFIDLPMTSRDSMNSLNPFRSPDTLAETIPRLSPRVSKIPLG